MKNSKLFDKLDLEFILGVQDCLEQYFNDQATEILLNSTFLTRLTEDPGYVYHYDEQYWADVIKRQHKH